MGNGRDANFWTDCWYKKGIYLKDTALNPLCDSELGKKVCDFILPNGDWDMAKLTENLPDDLCNEIANFHLIGGRNPGDMVAWNHPKELDFSVKYAYKILSKEDQLKTDKHWEIIWKWPGNQRTRTFMWLCAHDKVLTNNQRNKKNPTVDPVCELCKGSEETITHALRDCPVVQDV